MLSLEVTPFVEAVMVWKQGAKALTRSLNRAVVQVFKFVHVRLVHHADDWLGGNHVHLWVLELILVSRVHNTEAVVANQLLGFLLWLAVVASQWRGDTSRVQCADVWLVLPQLRGTGLSGASLTVLRSGWSWWT